MDFIVPLSFPPTPLDLTRKSGKVFVKCLIRKKAILLTPEEWVRQHIIAHLIKDLNYPETLVGVEKSIQYNGLTKRWDIVVFNSDFKPHLLVECKAPSIKLNEDTLKHYANTIGAKVVKGDEIYSLDVDVFAPCALGAILNTENINKLKCKVIAGAANNQLADENVHGNMLIEKGIAYAPDFLINAGGLINVYQEHIGYNRETAYRNAQRIYDVTLEIFKKSAAEKIHTQRAAIEMAEARINTILKVRSTF
jgi:hypothetical protein